MFLYGFLKLFVAFLGPHRSEVNNTNKKFKLYLAFMNHGELEQPPETLQMKSVWTKLFFKA